MKRRLLLALPALSALPALLAACRSPEPLYFTLAARPGQPLGSGPHLVELRRIGLAGYLDRPEIVHNNADYRLRLDANERWGEPLGDLIARVLAEDLNSRLPGTSVFTSTGAINATPDATIEIDLQRFDVDGSGQVLLLAQVAVSRRRRASAAQTVRLSVTPPGGTTTDVVAAMSTALAQLADRIAVLLRG